MTNISVPDRDDELHKPCWFGLGIIAGFFAIVIAAVKAVSR